MDSILIFLPLDNIFFLYGTIFLFISLTGVGFPVPEEAILIFTGYLAYLEFISFFGAIAVVFLAIVAADLFGYFLGMKLGNAVFERMLTKFSLTRKAFRSAGIYFEKYKEKAIIFTRPLIGVRIAVPILAGHFGVDFRKFLKYDIFAAAAWSVFWITLSYSLGSGLSLITKVKEVRHMVFLLLGIGIIVYAAIKFIGRDGEQIK